jgi:hypothetical protein
MKMIRVKRSASRTVDCADDRAEPHADAPLGAMALTYDEGFGR